MANVAVATLVQSVRRYVRDYPDQDQLTASVAAGATTLTVADTTLYYKNMTVEIDQEAFIVRAIGSGTSLTVKSGAFGTTAAVHTNSTDILLKPAFTTIQIVDAVNAAIQASYPWVYKDVLDTSLTALSNTYEYTVPNMPGTYGGDTIPIPRIRSLEVLDPGGNLPYVTLQAWNIRRDATTPVLKLGYLENTGATLRVRGYGPFPDVAYGGTLDPYYPRHIVQALVEYAGSVLLMSGEAGRVRTDTGLLDTREAAQRTGASMAAANGAEARFTRRLANAGQSPMQPHVVLSG